MRGFMADKFSSIFLISTRGVDFLPRTKILERRVIADKLQMYVNVLYTRVV